jgi:hypothetical protein
MRMCLNSSSRDRGNWRKRINETLAAVSNDFTTSTTTIVLIFNEVELRPSLYSGLIKSGENPLPQSVAMQKAILQILQYSLAKGVVKLRITLQVGD